MVIGCQVKMCKSGFENQVTKFVRKTDKFLSCCFKETYEERRRSWLNLNKSPTKCSISGTRDLG